MQTLNFDEFCKRSDIDRTVFGEVISKLPPVTVAGPWLAGGALRRLITEKPLDSDFDFFFRDEPQAVAFGDAMKTAGAKQVSGDGQATTWTLQIGKRTVKVQGIALQYYSGPADVLDSFDFTLCQLLYDGESLHCGDCALWDIARKRLAVHKITYAAASVRRFLKYQKEGYFICQGAIATLLKQVVDKPEIIQSEVEYVD